MSKNKEETRVQEVDPVRELAKELLCAHISSSYANGSDKEMVAEAYRIARAFEDFKEGGN